jgi:hypothetical protein
MTPTARSLLLLRREGYIAAPVERWLPHVHCRRDLFGFADVLAFHPRDRLFLLVQATTAAHVADRLAKARARPALALWLRAGGAFEVHGWAKRGDRWHVKRVGISPEDLAGVILESPRHWRRKRGERQRELFT